MLATNRPSLLGRSNVVGGVIKCPEEHLDGVFGKEEKSCPATRAELSTVEGCQFATHSKLISSPVSGRRKRGSGEGAAGLAVAKPGNIRLAYNLVSDRTAMAAPSSYDIVRAHWPHSNLHS